MDFNEEYEDENVGIYRCHDLTSTLAIKITISNKGSADPHTEEAVVQWQHKLFSPVELEKYCALETTSSALQKRLKEEALRLRAAAQPPANTVFTHIHQEDFIAQHERSQQLMKPAVRSSKLAETLMELRYRGPTAHSDEEPGGAAPGPETDQEPPDTQPDLTSVEQRLRSLSLCSTETMFIMLYAQSEEHVLCRLDWSQSGVLTVRPDFSPGSQPYRLQISEGQKGLYAYRLEWVPPPDETRPADLSTSHTQAPPPLRRRRDAPARLGPAPDFPLPAVGSLLVALSGELVSAGGFHGDNLFIHFFIELPKGWRAGDDTRLSGITQLCRAQDGRDAHFAFPVSAELVFTAPDDDEESDVCRWPTLYLEVLSEDLLGMTRTEGYCHMPVPATPGGLCRRLAAWRPAGSRQTQLRRYFIGGSPELEDPSFVAVPTDFQGSRLSRYGFRTETTGEVTVRLSAVHQSHGWATRPAAVSGGTAGGVGAVLEAFRRARLRMLRARQQLEQTAGGAGGGRARQQLEETAGGAGGGRRRPLVSADHRRTRLCGSAGYGRSEATRGSPSHARIYYIDNAAMCESPTTCREWSVCIVVGVWCGMHSSRFLVSRCFVQRYVMFHLIHHTAAALYLADAPYTPIHVIRTLTYLTPSISLGASQLCVRYILGEHVCLNRRPGTV